MSERILLNSDVKTERKTLLNDIDLKITDKIMMSLSIYRYVGWFILTLSERTH